MQGERDKGGAEVPWAFSSTAEHSSVVPSQLLCMEVLNTQWKLSGKYSFNLKSLLKTLETVGFKIIENHSADSCIYLALMGTYLWALCSIIYVCPSFLDYSN